MPDSSVFLSDSRIAALGARVTREAEPTFTAYHQLHAAAEADLDRQPHAPREWYVPGFYRDAPGHQRAKLGLQEDANAAYRLALCHRLTGDERYARPAVRLLDAWATTPRVMSDRDDSTLSFSYHFPALIFAADLLRGFDGWPAADQRTFARFVRERALPLSTIDRPNNWGNWGLVLTLAAAAFLGDRALFSAGVARWRDLIETQIAPDGHLPHEVTRNNGRGEAGIWYSHFTLLPQTIAAEIARVNGVDLYDYRSPSGRTLRAAFERIAAWTRRPATFPYFQEDPALLVGRAYISYFEVLNARWPHPDATALLAELRPLSADHSAPALTFTHGDLPGDTENTPLGS